MNKRIIISFILLSIFLFLITYIFIYKIENKKEFGSSLAIMVYDSDIGDYIKTSTIPKYKTLNEDKSNCQSGANIQNYNAKNGVITYNFTTGDKCFLYFDEYTLANYIKDFVYIEDGVNDLYYHDGKGSYNNANLEIGDDSYRYSGANPDNYVCFLGDDCANEDNLYRIIGLDGATNRIKLIKSTSIVNMPWNSNSSAYDNTWEGSTLDRYLNSMQPNYTYFYSIEREIPGFLYTLGNKANLIAPNTWYASGFRWRDLESENAKGIYNLETSASIKTTQNQKIGIMYVHDYMYGASPNYWHKTAYSPDNDDYRISRDYNWMFYDLSEWTITPYISDTDTSFYINHGPVVNGYVYDAYKVRPVFYLLPTVKIINADSINVGLKLNPMIIN